MRPIILPSSGRTITPHIDHSCEIVYLRVACSDEMSTLQELLKYVSSIVLTPSVLFLEPSNASCH